MSKFDWRAVELALGVLREPTPDDSRIVLWLAGPRAQGVQNWERVSNVPGAEIIEEQGICSTPAVCMPARQKIRGLVGKLVRWLQKPAPGTWLLPTGGHAEESGQRHGGLLFAWLAEPPAAKGTLPQSWLMGRGARTVGNNLFIVEVAPAAAVGDAVVAELRGDPKAQAEQLLADARRAGDRRAEAGALTDWGIALTRSGEGHAGAKTLEEALAAARALPDADLENDARANLGMALLAVGQAPRGLEVLGETLAFARESGNRFLEKSTLANIAIILATMRNHAEALATCEHALKLARELEDRPHEADLLWFQAIAHAELGHADEATRLAQRAIDIHATLRSPHVAWLSGQLKKFRPPRPAPVPAPAAKSYYTGSAAAKAPTLAPPAPVVSVAPCDPSVLRTALAAVRTLESSAASGMKTVAPEVFQKRLDVCAVCPEHTGMRCKLSGSFTGAIAWLPHERCPLGKWG